MGRIVIAAYRPKPGRSHALERLMRRHHQRLRGEGLVADRLPALMRASDGTIVEVFEWLSPNAISEVHNSATVQSMWREYAEVSDYVPLAELKESAASFAEFEPLSMAEDLHPEFSP
jgi:hypothetical protein